MSQSLDFNTFQQSGGVDVQNDISYSMTGINREERNPYVKLQSKPINEIYESHPLNSGTNSDNSLGPSSSGNTIDNRTKSTEKVPIARKKKNSTTNTKTISALGSGQPRVAQACDRCRAKKTKCDGKQPSCSGCEAIGIKCIVSDKLSRRAFPKGYTEILEERIRQLEAENSRLGDLVNQKDEQVKSFKDESNISSSVTPEDTTEVKEPIFNDSFKSHQEHYSAHGDGCSCGCTDSIHERPVSMLGNDNHGPFSITDSLDLSDDEDETNSLLSTDDERISNSLGSILLQRNVLYSNKFNNNSSKPAPGAFAAATAIEKMQKSKQLLDKQQMLTALVAASIPRSTEETLFVPTLLAGICQNYGYDSKPAILAANAIGSLKKGNANEINSRSPEDYDSIDERILKLIMNRTNVNILNNQECLFFIQNLNLPQSRMEIDHLITMYFKEWGSTLPVLNRSCFLDGYSMLMNVLETSRLPNDSPSPPDMSRTYSNSRERFGAVMILVIALGYLSNKHIFFSTKESQKHIVDKYGQDLRHYDYLIHKFIQPHCLITNICSIQSLQILTLALQYCLAIGDVTTCFELRGRVITMAQQLRLHRCPAAVLGVSGMNNNSDVNLKNPQQGERRILFWSVYILDVYSSLNLGVPRLLKDDEIECALPFAGKEVDDDEEENENILIVNNTKLTIVGKVSRYSLSIMLYARVLAEILDGIYSSSSSDTPEYEAAQRRQSRLELWRRELPEELLFELGANGLTLKSENESSNHWNLYSKQQLSLVFLYFHARILIYLPVISKFGNHFDVGLSQKQKLFRGTNNKQSVISSISMIQQSSLQILEILKILFDPLDSSTLAIPINLPREHARLAILVAKGTLDYIKGGALYSHSKQLLLDTIPLLMRESKYQVPGGLMKNSAKLVEMAILSILGLPSNKTYSLKKKSQQPIKPVDKPDRKPSALSQVVHADEVNEDFKMNIEDFIEDIDTILEFDPFKVDLSQNLLNEFAADGSLGLVPFLNEEEFDIQ